MRLKKIKGVPRAIIPNEDLKFKRGAGTFEDTMLYIEIFNGVNVSPRIGYHLSNESYFLLLVYIYDWMNYSVKVFLTY